MHQCFKVTTSKGRYKSKNIIVASGFYDRPFILNVPGENLDKVRHYYKEPHPYFAMDVAVSRRISAPPAGRDPVSLFHRPRHRRTQYGAEAPWWRRSAQRS
mgnify:CR=1 FL=1